MKHFASLKFWAAYEKLPPSVRKLADDNYELLKRDPRHPSLHFKKIGRYGPCVLACAMAHSPSK